MDLSVKYKQVMTSSEAYEVATKEITQEYIDSFGMAVDVSRDQSRSTISAKGKGFELTLCFKDYECEVSLDLSFMFRPFKGKILEGIQKKLEKHL